MRVEQQNANMVDALNKNIGPENAENVLFQEALIGKGAFGAAECKYGRCTE